MILHTYMYKKAVEIVYFTTRIKPEGIYCDAVTKLGELAASFLTRHRLRRFP